MKFLIFCMGNICRSPVVAEVVRSRFAKAGLDIAIESAGTENYHVGEPADARAIASARAAGYDIGSHRARQLTAADFVAFDRLYAMDRVNLRAALRCCAPEHAAKAMLFLPAAGIADVSEVPDPYYGGHADFQRVIELAERGAGALIERLKKGA